MYKMKDGTEVRFVSFLKSSVVVEELKPSGVDENGMPIFKTHTLSREMDYGSVTANGFVVV